MLRARLAEIKEREHLEKISDIKGVQQKIGRMGQPDPLLRFHALHPSPRTIAPLAMKTATFKTSWTAT